MSLEPTKCCCNCYYNIPVYKRGNIVAHLCKYDIDEVISGERLADDCTDIKNCGRWKACDE